MRAKFMFDWMEHIFCIHKYWLKGHGGQNRNGIPLPGLVAQWILDNVVILILLYSIPDNLYNICAGFKTKFAPK